MEIQTFAKQNTRKRCLALDAFSLAPKKYCSFKSRTGANNAHQIHYSELNVSTQSCVRTATDETCIAQQLQAAFQKKEKTETELEKTEKDKETNNINHKITSQKNQ